MAPGSETWRLRQDLSQDQHIEGTPLGTVGTEMWTRDEPPPEREWLSDLLDDGTCTGKTDGALRIVNAALRYSEATSARATFGIELLHRFEPSLGR